MELYFLEKSVILTSWGKNRQITLTHLNKLLKVYSDADVKQNRKAYLITLYQPGFVFFYILTLLSKLSKMYRHSKRHLQSNPTEIMSKITSE